MLTVSLPCPTGGDQLRLSIGGFRSFMKQLDVYPEYTTSQDSNTKYRNVIRIKALYFDLQIF
jgi:hypothetical protein